MLPWSATDCAAPVRIEATRAPPRARTRRARSGQRIATWVPSDARVGTPMPVAICRGRYFAFTVETVLRRFEPWWQRRGCRRHR